MAENDREEPEAYANERLEIAEDVTNRYIIMLERLLQHETNLIVQAKIKLEILELKIELRILRRVVAEKLAEILARN